MPNRRIHDENTANCVVGDCAGAGDFASRSVCRAASTRRRAPEIVRLGTLGADGQASLCRVPQNPGTERAAPIGRAAIVRRLAIHPLDQWEIRRSRSMPLRPQGAGIRHARRETFPSTGRERHRDSGASFSRWPDQRRGLCRSVRAPRAGTYGNARTDRLQRRYADNRNRRHVACQHAASLRSVALDQGGMGRGLARRRPSLGRAQALVVEHRRPHRRPPRYGRLDRGCL